ncbi:DUF1824 family protein [Candidatus Gracilibacteria bacterium]|jgi:Domain of unknown function (DUF1824)|nr:DUF1824 family protein [Candidatus Gracilibacteria bacterium]NJM86670.1 DUF1824 family protein [Hydrococcus sp. RU_2_2]NJP20581.1 DUF1824 family protein [Hydrococcus sp. CRU_1_1]
MTTQPSTNLPVEEALQLLKKFSCTAIATVESEIELEQLRQALLLVTSLSESENLGICADNAQQGFAALSSYLKAFGYQADCDPTLASDLQGAIYIKFNTQKMSYYFDSYTGNYRGVLVSCQSDNDMLLGTYGHFPLDLFAHF